MNGQKQSKNIVICCDGTGNQFGDHNSNVIKLFSMLKSDIDDQILYYHPGVGTKGQMELPTYFGVLSQKINKWHALAYGYGLISNLGHAYHFLMRHYSPGDRVYIFGFSRGAFTARALSSMLYEFGLLEIGNDALIEYAMSLFTNPNAINFKIAKSFKATFGRECPVHFVGVWDTVATVGWIYSPLSIPYTRENPNIRIGRQALAIDECRSFFRPNLWGHAHGGQDFKQVWFTGVHSDVGGGYPYEQSGLANITLHWMAREAKTAGLKFDEQKTELQMKENPPDPNAILHRSLKGIWWIPEHLPQSYPVRVNNHFVKKWGFHHGRARFIPENSLIHESVMKRIDNSENGYRPINLPEHFQVVS